MIRAYYEFYGAESNLSNVHVAAGHNYNAETRKAVYAWFHQHLKAQGPLITSPDAVSQEVGKLGDLRVFPDRLLPENILMPDYRPLLPWFGVLLLGLFFGNAFYLSRKGAPAAPPPLAAPIAFVGRHTLFVYLVHQPVLIATLWAVGIVRF